MIRKGAKIHQRFRVACLGIKEAYRRERSFRFQIWLAMGLFIFCLVARPTFAWCSIFVAMSALVLSLEMVNSAVEALLDRLHPQLHPEVGFAKDCLAGAVLIASLASLVTFIFYLWSRFQA